MSCRPAGSGLFLATERSLDRQVVVKILPPELASEVSAARFQREVTLAAHLQHPHILPVLSAGSRDGILYYITPYVDGESLRQRLIREPKLPVNTALHILSETASALARAHTAGVIHRDIKPENILLQDGHALLSDFGVARAGPVGLRWWAERGDTADIHAFLAARTTNAPFDPNTDARPATYDTAVARAYLYVAKHDTAEAMRRFAALPDTLCLGQCELDTVTWGDLLTTHGRAAEADSLLQREETTPFWDFGTLLRTLALARAADRAGDKQTAIDAYASRRTWADADPELQPAVKEARAALARLSSDKR